MANKKNSNISEASVNLEPIVEALQAAVSLGGILLAARVEKNLTQKNVSDNLRLSIKQIEALEQNDFTALPSPMITRGFIRNVGFTAF